MSMSHFSPVSTGDSEFKAKRLYLRHEVYAQHLGGMGQLWSGSQESR